MSTRYNTGNPIESTDVRDMSDNAKNFDEFSNSTSDSFTDRLGRSRQTIEGTIRKAGFQPASFDFVTGGTLVSGDRNKAVFNPEPSGDNNWYAWQGSLPKVVPSGSTPSTTGGIGDNAWKPVTNNILAPTVMESIRRSYAEAGYNLVDGSFEAGGTLVNANDVLLQERTGKAFSGPAGAVSAGTDPTSGGFVDVSTSGFIPMLYAGIRAYNGETKNIRCIGNYNVFDGQYGTFVRDDSDTTSADDGVIVLIDAIGRRWKRQHVGPLLPRFAGVTGDGVVDDYAACAALIGAFKKRGVAAPGGTDMRGDGIDWTGYKCRLSQKLDLTGIFNYNFTNPTFAAHSSFSGSALLKIDSDGTYYVSGITWVNPQLDGAWLADYCVEAYDFLKWSLIGGKFTHYKKKGFITGTVIFAPHEINAIGTFFFQREYNETYPPSVTEGEAFELNNYDNEFTSIVIGYQKSWAATSNQGANRYIGGHIYTGNNSNPLVGAFRALGDEEYFSGTYFDHTCLETLDRVTVNACDFGVSQTGKAIKFGKSPFLVKVEGCNFFKSTNDAVNSVFQMPTIAEGRTARPIVRNNTFDRCFGFATSGLLFTTLNGWETNVTVPDYYLPLSNHGDPIKVGDSPSTGYSVFTTLFNVSTNVLTLRSYRIDANGALQPNTAGSISAAIPINM